MIRASDAVIIPHSPCEIAPSRPPAKQSHHVAGTRQGCGSQANSTKGSGTHVTGLQSLQGRNTDPSEERAGTAPQFFRSRKILAFSHAAPGVKTRTTTQKAPLPKALPRFISLLFLFAFAFTLFIAPPSAQAGPNPLEGPARATHEDLTLVDPAARSVTLTHGRKTKDVYILLHGLSNAPTQFRQFGDLLYRSGANVVIPRMPYHGYLDRMTEAQEHLTARSMIANAEAALAHAHTLGEHVTVVGLSAGGVTAAWIAQNRPDVDRVFLLAPFFAIGFLPDWFTVPTRDIFATLPNSFVWWDPRQGRNLKGSPYAYPRFSTRAMSQLIRLGTTVFAEARRTAPAVRYIEIITNPADLAVNNARTTALVKLWEKRRTSQIKLYEFPGQWDLPHDFIDPWHPDRQIDRVYPILLQQLGIKH